MKTFRKWLMSLLVSSNYEGPAKFEVFGKDEHVGWVRAGAERIDILTVEGQAIQVDTRARFRLTPITWQELANEALSAQRWRDEATRTHRSVEESLREKIDDRDSRIEDLRKAIAQSRDELADYGGADKIVDALNEALRYDEEQAEHDENPF